MGCGRVLCRAVGLVGGGRSFDQRRDMKPGCRKACNEFEQIQDLLKRGLVGLEFVEGDRLMVLGRD